METYKVDLNPLQKQPIIFQRISYLVGVIYIFSGIYFLVQDFTFLSSGWLWILGGAVIILSNYHQIGRSSKHFLEMNEELILFKQSISKAKIVSWISIKSIDIKPISIEFFIDDKTKETLSLGNVGYQNVLEIKQKLKDYASFKNIKLS